MFAYLFLLLQSIDLRQVDAVIKILTVLLVDHYEKKNVLTNFSQTSSYLIFEGRYRISKV